MKYFSLTLCFLASEENKLKKKKAEREGINANEKLNDIFVLHARGLLYTPGVKIPGVKIKVNICVYKWMYTGID